jgi:hypothetical protein
MNAIKLAVACLSRGAFFLPGWRKGLNSRLGKRLLEPE